MPDSSNFSKIPICVDCNMLYVAALFFPRHLVNYLLQDFSQLKFLFIFVVWKDKDKKPWKNQV